MPLYSDTKLEYRPLTPDMLCYAERIQLREMNGYYIPDDTKPFYDNLVLKYKYDLKKEAIKQILEIKQNYFRETGEKL